MKASQPLPGRSVAILAASFSAAILLATPAAQAQLDRTAPLNWKAARDVITEKQLQTAAAASKPLKDQLAMMVKPMEGPPPGEGHSLYRSSIILYDGECYTLVPIGSVLHLPANLRNRVLAAPQGEFTFWPNFLRRNSKWLAAKEVPLKMAKGDQALAAVVLKDVAGSQQLLVSVYRDCPISVLQPAPPKQASTSTQR